MLFILRHRKYILIIKINLIIINFNVIITILWTVSIQSHSVFCFSQHFGHGRELEFARTGRGFREKGEIIGELNGSGFYLFHVVFSSIC